MTTTTYLQRRGELKTYFDDTAAEAWERLTSSAPVGRIRESVRRGRNEMLDLLLDWLPQELGNRSLLDAGCGTGALSVCAARRGADVVGIELSPRLLALAHERTPDRLLANRISYVADDMLNPEFGEFDFVVAMDSLIHYGTTDTIEALAQLTSRTREAVLFTLAPRTPLLALMHALGRAFPRDQRAPAIEPVHIDRLGADIRCDRRFAGWKLRRRHRIATGFYTSEAIELVRQ